MLYVLEVFGWVLVLGVEEQQVYFVSGVICYVDWQEWCIDFQFYFYLSYIEELVWWLKDILIEGNNVFFVSFDLCQVVSDLVDDCFVCQVLVEVGGLQVFGFVEGFQCSEEISL